MSARVKGKDRAEDMEIGAMKGKIEGGAEGEKQVKMAVAKSLLKVGISVDLIAESTDLPQAEIRQLQKEIA